GKTYFQSNIDKALDNLSDLLEKKIQTPDLPEMKRIVRETIHERKKQRTIIPKNDLTIRVASFSYKRGIPPDPSGNGGGFVFDCRALTNPGKLDEYKNICGLDPEVVDYMERYSENLRFQESIQKLAEPSLLEYAKRGFNHLCFSFGCTGGQHRSVYHAEKFARWVKNNFPVNVVIIHTEKENWNSHGKKEM
ncbi:MAG TPA: RNase adapter RapZ, partial [Prolixibacteraceae bacterium]|nr:RNase adapter RapZ [Prolixibacteraceae bacterium]